MGRNWAAILVLLLGSSLFAAPASAGDHLAVREPLLVDRAAQMQPDAQPSVTWGTPFSVDLTTPGQRATYTFSGAADQVVTAVMDDSTVPGCWTALAIMTPQMTRLASNPTCGPHVALKHMHLPAAGSYTLQLTPAGSSVGHAMLTLYTVEDVVGTIPTDGSPVSVELTTPGQLANLTFQGRAGQVVTAQLSDSTIPGCWTALTILGPDHRQVAHAPTCGTSVLLAHKTLPADGTYTLSLSPASVATGQATLTLYGVVDVGGSIGSVATADASAPDSPQ